MKAPARGLGRVRWVLLLACLALALSAAGWVGWRDFHRFENQTFGVDRVIEFKRGMRLRDLAEHLRADGISTAPYWQWRLLAERMQVAQVLKAGEYKVEAQATPGLLLRAMADGKVVQYRFTILEGTRFRDLRSALAGIPELTATLGGLADADVLTRVGATEVHPEGLFLPDTYFFPRGFTDLELLKRAYWANKRTLEAAWEARAPELPLADAYQALILASIIEKETGRAQERPEIGGVFVNRLRKGWRLQTDPTVIYGLGDAFDGNLRRADLESDTPYNTYTRFGLPPTPIALPGRAAIEAATQPATTEAMYFVARGDGTHVFSRTLEEHNRAVARFQLGQP